MAEFNDKYRRVAVLFINVDLFIFFNFVGIKSLIIYTLFYGEFCWLLYKIQMKRDNIL